ncbi:MAG: sigma 54-interacting transcriptional regulator, partial [Planctomycetota bacterium]
VLQEGEIRPVGGKEIIAIHARIVSATNHLLVGRIKEGKFREDLYYRLCVIELHIPPLRERLEDIPPLIEHFLEEESQKSQQPRKELDKSILNYLMNYSWPGNVRELKNEVQRWHAMAEETISLTYVSDRIRQNLTKSRILNQKRTFKEQLEEYERALISQKLSETKNNKSRAAKELGLSRDGLRKILIRFGMDDSASNESES